MSTLPKWLRTAWFLLSPLELSFAARIAWEKTVWTLRRGPQNVGFSLMHTAPAFFVVGLFCCCALILWWIAALVYFVARRKPVNALDLAMTALSLFATAALMIPDTFFA